MKKIFATLFILFFSIPTSIAFYDSSNNTFISSPSISEIESIEDKITRVCEGVFLEAYMRRDFTENENKLCSDIFEVKIESQLTYMRTVMNERGIY